MESVLSQYMNIQDNSRKSIEALREKVIWELNDFSHSYLCMYTEDTNILQRMYTLTCDSFISHISKEEISAINGFVYILLNGGCIVHDNEYDILRYISYSLLKTTVLLDILGVCTTIYWKQRNS